MLQIMKDFVSQSPSGLILFRFIGNFRYSEIPKRGVFMNKRPYIK